MVLFQVTLFIDHCLFDYLFRYDNKNVCQENININIPDDCDFGKTTTKLMSCVRMFFTNYVDKTSYYIFSVFHI